MILESTNIGTAIRFRAACRGVNYETEAEAIKELVKALVNIVPIGRLDEVKWSFGMKMEVDGLTRVIDWQWDFPI